MTRVILVVVGALLAAFALFHPVAKAPPALATVSPPARTLPAREPSPRASQASMAVVYVAGAVRRPGLYRIAPGARVDDAVRAAGGLARDADSVAVNLAARTEDGEEIAVPRVGDAALARRRTRAPAARSRRVRSKKAIPSSPVDVNVAGATLLATVPGLGPALAARIVAVRERDGAFTTLDELLDVAGMTPARLDRARSYLRI
jgi:competence protein ComEA